MLILKITARGGFEDFFPQAKISYFAVINPV